MCAAHVCLCRKYPTPTQARKKASEKRAKKNKENDVPAAASLAEPTKRGRIRFTKSYDVPGLPDWKKTGCWLGVKKSRLQLLQTMSTMREVFLLKATRQQEGTLLTLTG